MDTSDPGIYFDENGVCNHCHNFEKRIKNEVFFNDGDDRKLLSLVDKIKDRGRKGEYDCIIGLSGGVDSSYVAYLVKRWGLRPLAVHLDNGWDSELSVHNIENLVKKLKIDLYTHVIDWEEFKDLQLSFMKSSIINCEMPSDHAITASMIKTALINKIRYVLIGSNIMTEAIYPALWEYDYKDLTLLKDIHHKYGRGNLKTFPELSTWQWITAVYLRGIRVIPILNYVKYIKDEAKGIIKAELDWRDYGGKHSESVFTRFYQSYLLPKKFAIDKRRAHLSSMVCSGQLSRDEALREISKPLYTDLAAEEQDKIYVQKKLGLSDDEFASILAAPVRSYQDFRNESQIWKRLSYFVQLSKRIITGHL
jgi:N-acetyl sugar amidotransferase